MLVQVDVHVGRADAAEQLEVRQVRCDLRLELAGEVVAGAGVEVQAAAPVGRGVLVEHLGEAVQGEVAEAVDVFADARGVAVRGDDQDVIAVQTLQGLRQGGDAAAAVAVVAGRRR